MYNFSGMKRLISLVPGLLLLGFVQLALAGDLAEEVLFDISPQSLDSALLEFSQQANTQLVVAANSLDGIKTQGISGQVTGNNALSTLLKDTGLRFNVVGSTVTVTNSPTDEANMSGKSRPASSNNLVAQVGTSAKQSQTTATAATNSEADKTETGINTIEEVVVTARKREENLQDVPISISAFSAADLEAMSLTSLKELGQFTPNFCFFNHSSRGRSAGMLFIRGVGQTDPRID